MTRTLGGMTVSGTVVTFVEVEARDDEVPTLILDQDFKLGTSDRAADYLTLFRRIETEVRERKIREVILLGSAASRSGMGLSHLRAAELRGVAAAGAAAGKARVFEKTRAHLSRTFGSRKAEEYVKDDEFWDGKFVGALRKGSRTAALLVLAHLAEEP